MQPAYGTAAPACSDSDSDSDTDSEEAPMNITLRRQGSAPVAATINRNGSVADMKAAIAEQHAVDASRLRLIYKGRILKDHVTPPELGLEEGHDVHMVVEKPLEKATVVVPANPNEAVALPGVGAVKMEEFKRNPIIEQMAEDPAKLREFVLAANPGMAEEMERDPHLAAVMNDPARLREMSAMLKNPVLLNEANRNLDRRALQTGVSMPVRPAQFDADAHAAPPTLPAWAAPPGSMPGMPMQMPPHAPNGAPLPPPPTAPPSGIDFSRQLHQLSSMGFTDLRDNLTALHLFKGNVEFAAQFLKDGGLAQAVDQP